MRTEAFVVGLSLFAALFAGVACGARASQPDDGQQDGASRARTVRDMQVINIRPRRHGRVYAARTENGELVVTHKPPRQGQDKP